MSSTLSPEAADIFARAQRGPLTTRIQGAEPLRDRAQIEQLIPHREPFLFVDRVDSIDLEGNVIAGRCDLERIEYVFRGHFPGRPLMPGVIQIEAVAQLGILLEAERAGGGATAAVTLTHVLGARYLRPVLPGGDVEICAEVVNDGLFYQIVGQCLQNGEVCSAVAVNGLAAW
jgi:3-hydroxymyristoyl/3-hydroxydecanoyl-(acyl carrier protein) dehydratase